MFTALAAVLVAWTATFGRFASHDDIAFKSPGRELAATGRFASPELTWFVVPLTVSPARVYGLQMPVYPLAFGGWTKVFGLGWRQAFVFDVAIHVLFAASLANFVASLAGRSATGAPSAAAAWLLASALLPLGIASTGRPDFLAMAMCLTSQGLIVAGPLSAARGTAAGILAALAAFTSPIGFLCCMMAFSGAGLTLAWRHRDVRVNAVIAAVVASVTGLATLMLIYASWPQAVAQFLEHSRSVRGHAALASALATHWTFYRWTVAGPLLAFGCMLILFAVELVRRAPGSLAVALAASTVASFLLALFGFHSPYYLWFPVPYALAAVFLLAQGASAQRERWVRHAVTAATMAIVSVSVVFDLWRYSMLLRGGSEQGWSYNADLLLTLIPVDAVVLADEHWFSVASSRAVLDANFTLPEAMPLVTHVVLTGNGAGAAFQRKRLARPVEEVLQREFTVVHRGLNSHPLTFLGRQIGNSAYGMGFELLARRREPDSATENRTRLSP